MLHSVRRRSGAAAVAALVCLTSTIASAGPATAAPADPEPKTPDDVMAQVADYCGEYCYDILPPGQNGNATLVEILSHQALGTMPSHSGDQLAAYDDLLHNYSGLTNDQLDAFFNDASFGVPEDQVESEVQPRDDVKIVRDKATGTPHIYGTTREGTMFGAGYAAAADRLFLMDVLRNLGRGELTGFAGGAASNRQLEQDLWAGAPYTKEDKQHQIDRIANSGDRGARALEDVRGYLTGINAYIDESEKNRDYPGEYVLTGHKDAITQAGEIEHFTETDIVGIASVIGLLFGNGGGGEVGSALAKLAFQKRYGEEEGTEVWSTWRTANDPEAVKTVHEGEFPYSQAPKDPKNVAMPDPGSVEPYDIVHEESGSAASGATAKPLAQTAEHDTMDAPTEAGEDIDTKDLEPAKGIFNDGVLPGDLIEEGGSMSNALLVSGEHTKSGHPISVSGPQTGYYSPQLLLVQEIQGPGISARGASFPGLSFYVQMGRGADYAWSATSAGQDITDTFAVELCEPGGGEAGTDSRHYRDGEECVPFEKLKRHNEWSPTVADQTPAGSYTLVSLRSKFGLVESFATVEGTPVAYVSRRSTYQHEVDSIIGFQKLNDPAAVHSAEDFQSAVSDIGYAFNWFYADADDIAYFNSGANPVRTEGTDPNMPIWADSASGWRGWDPATNGTDYTPPEQHPQAVNQGYLTSWNNKQAAGYTSGYGMGPVHRADLLDSRLAARIEDGHEFTPASLTKVMEEAATVDLRGEQVLPELMRVIESEAVGDPELAATVEKLRAWMESGAQRKEENKHDGVYAYSDAIRVMDAWWPLLVEAQFRPGLGEDLYTSMAALVQVGETPNSDGQHKGSAFQSGWWSYVDKDLRTVLGDDVDAPLGEAYCGGGDLGQCRQVLLDTLTEAAATPAEEVYPGDADCEPGDQLCADAIIHNALGGINQNRIAWQNRPTYQAVMQFTDRRG